MSAEDSVLAPVPWKPPPPPPMPPLPGVSHCWCCGRFACNTGESRRECPKCYVTWSVVPVDGLPGDYYPAQWLLTRFDIGRFVDHATEYAPSPA